jgi:uncharacterized membrane protein YtjA (UPF0391 family)
MVVMSALPSCLMHVADSGPIQQGPRPCHPAPAHRIVWPDGQAPPPVGTRSVPESWISGFAARRRPQRKLEDLTVTLLKWALIFFVVSIIAGILGFTGISAASADVARFLFYVFVVIFLVLLILGLTIFRV